MNIVVLDINRLNQIIINKNDEQIPNTDCSRYCSDRLLKCKHPHNLIIAYFVLQAYSVTELQDMSMKSIIDSHYSTVEARILRHSGKALKGQVKYNILADIQKDFPEIIMVEDFLYGFIQGSSFSGTGQCKSALTGMLGQAFELVKYREVYNPAYTMKALIAAQKLQQQQALFYA